MNPEQWARVKELFHQALERAPEERPAFVAEASGGDEEARSEVERLLAAHAMADGFIEQPPVERPGIAGRTLGRYEVGRLLGVGGMGEVYAARDTELGRQVALKISTSDNAGAQARLRREAQHASHLNHPNICTVYEVGEFGGRCYIAMEYVEGRPLSDLIAGGLPIDTAVRYGIQIADALAHAHGAGVVHRDLKTANVVVTPDGRPKILDFGLARRLDAAQIEQLSASRMSFVPESPMAGTLSYMAPELLRGDNADARTDIWAFGVLLHEMAAGARPFAGGTGFELSGAILHEPPAPLPPAVPTVLKEIIRRCLAKKPDERYQRAAELRSALEGVQLGGRLSARAGRVAGVAIVVALLVAAGLAVSWSRLAPAKASITPVTAKRPAIAVLNFDNLAGGDDTSWMSKGVPSMLLTGLAQSRGLDIVSPARLREAATEMGGKELDTLGRKELTDVAKHAGAGVAVVGGISKAGSEIRIDAQVEDLSSGRILAADSVRGTDLFAIVDQLAARIRDSVGFRDDGQLQHITELSSASLDAYRLYTLGVDAYVNGRPDDAQGPLEQAVAIDPTFAEAYLQLAFVAGPRGHPGERIAYLRKAAEHPERLSEQRRLLLEVQLARDNGHFDEAARRLDELIARFPTVEPSANIALQLYMTPFGPLHNSEKLLGIARGSVAAVPSSRNARSIYAYALADAGLMKEAVREFETLIQMAPREPNPYDSLAETYLLDGAPQKAAELYSRALTVDPTFSASHIGRAWALAMMGRYDDALAEKPLSAAVNAAILSRAGRYREAEEVLEAGRRRAGNNSNAPEHGSLFLVSAMLAIELKDYGRALEDCRLAGRIFATMPVQARRGYVELSEMISGVAESRAGRLREARTHLDSQRAFIDASVEVERWWNKALEGEIALGQGDAAQAGTAFSEGQPSKRMWFVMNLTGQSILSNSLGRDGLARVAVARGDLTRAIEEYRRLLMYGPEQKWISAYEPRYVLEIARLLERTGDKAGARREYQHFLDLWKRADPGLSELDEAKRAVAAEKG